MIESQHPETKTFKYWNQMHSDIEFMISLLADLSTFNNGERIQKIPFSSHEFLSRICLSFAASTIESDIEFTSSIPNDLPMIEGDQLKLTEALMNLLKNAKESILQKGQISLTSYQKNNQLYIEISDTGCGIQPEYLETLFDTFVTHKAEGTGLGLSIAKRVVEAHGGAIHVTSKIHVGTTFSVSLPVA